MQILHWFHKVLSKRPSWAIIICNTTLIYVFTLPPPCCMNRPDPMCCSSYSITAELFHAWLWVTVLGQLAHVSTPFCDSWYVYT